MKTTRWYQIHLSTAFWMMLTAGVLMTRQFRPAYTTYGSAQYGWPYAYLYAPTCCGIDFEKFYIDIAISLIVVVIVALALEFAIRHDAKARVS